MSCKQIRGNVFRWQMNASAASAEQLAYLRHGATANAQTRRHLRARILEGGELLAPGAHLAGWPRVIPGQRLYIVYLAALHRIISVPVVLSHDAATRASLLE